MQYILLPMHLSVFVGNVVEANKWSQQNAHTNMKQMNQDYNDNSNGNRNTKREQKYCEQVNSKHVSIRDEEWNQDEEKINIHIVQENATHVSTTHLNYISHLMNKIHNKARLFMPPIYIHWEDESHYYCMLYGYHTKPL